MKTSFIRLNTALKLPDDVEREVIKLSREIGQNNDSFFILDGVQFYPHITIYSPEYPESNFNKALKIVEGIANQTKKIELNFLSLESHDGYIGICFETSPEIKNLHKEVVGKLNLLREGSVRKKYKQGSDYHMDFSRQQLKNIARYGYPDAMNLYHPHLTIIRLRDDFLAKVITKNLNWKKPQIVIDKLAVYTMGEHGTCRKLVKEFSLK